MPRIFCNNNQSCCPRDWWRNLPELSRATPADACVCQSYSFAFAVESGMAPYTWTISDTPPGMTFDSDTGILSGVPTFADTYSFTIGVSDVFGREDSQDYSLVINPASAASCAIEIDGAAVIAFDGSYVDLTWDAPTFPFADDSYYQILKDGVLLVQIGVGEVGANAYTDTAVVPGQAYEYVINFHHGSSCPEIVYAILEEGGPGLMEEGGEAAFLEE